ncbi:hypothetical protein LA080_014224 [Diaporthe eres]|nr:hypothetical protein LA080_014224 [Diaporthe eres]
MAAPVSSPAGPRDVQVTSPETSHHGLVLDVDVPQASGKHPPPTSPLLQVTESTSSPCAPTGMLRICRREHDCSGRGVLANSERSRPPEGRDPSTKGRRNNLLFDSRKHRRQALLVSTAIEAIQLGGVGHKHLRLA